MTTTSEATLAAAFGPIDIPIPGSSHDMAKLIGTAIRSLWSAYIDVVEALRYTPTDFPRVATNRDMREMGVNFWACIGGTVKLPHFFSVEIVYAGRYRVGITCEEFNVAELDALNLQAALAEFFERPVMVKLVNGKLEFTLPNP